MNYMQELIEKIKDLSNWPSFERPDFLADLNTVADEAFEKATVEGYLAALLIYHQLCEELVHILFLRMRNSSYNYLCFQQRLIFHRRKG